jgi:hypothetical protein
METQEAALVNRAIRTPYSLGKLIEWKHSLAQCGYNGNGGNFGTPYSLGKLIEWKPELY